MITQALTQLGNWAWPALGLVLLALELVAPGTFFMWLGLAALAVGAIAFFVDLGWQIELVLFGVLALVFVILGRRYFARRGDNNTDTPGLNARATSFVGRELTLHEPLVDGTGRVKIGDTLWRVEGPDMPAGTRARVTSARGGPLQVDRLEA